MTQYLAHTQKNICSPPYLTNKKPSNSCDISLESRPKIKFLKKHIYSDSKMH